MQVHVLLMVSDMDLGLRLVSVLEGYMLGVRWDWRVWSYTSLYCEVKIRKDISLGNSGRVKNNTSINGLILLLLLLLLPLSRSLFFSLRGATLNGTTFQTYIYLEYCKKEKMGSIQDQKDPNMPSVELL